MRNAPRTLWKAGLLLLVFLLGCFNLENADIWWHLRAGQLIWQRFEIPRTDWFTFTNPNAAWIDLHWGFQLLAAGLWFLGGSAALILAKSAVGSLTMAIAMSIEKRDWSPAASVACWLIPMLIFVGRYLVRPEMLTGLFLACTLAILFHARRVPWLIWLLPFVQLCWVNVQGLFVLQFVVLGCFWVGQAFGHVTQWAFAQESDRIPARRLLLASAATVLATLANPYGLQGALFPLTLFARVRGPEREFFFDFSNELEGLNEFVQQYGLFGLVADFTTLCLLELTLGLLISFLLLWRFRRLNVYHLLLALAFAYLAWQMNRNSVLYALAGGVVFRQNIGQWWELRVNQVREQRSLKRVPQEVHLPFESQATRLRFALGTLLALLIISVPTGLYYQLRTPWFHRQFGLGQSQWYPHAGAIFLQDPRLPDRVFAAHLGVAAVCIFHLAPEKLVFADARLETNTPQTLKAHQQVLRRLAFGGDYQSLLRGNFAGSGALATDSDDLPPIIINNALLVKSPELHAGLMRDNWRCVFYDDHIGDNFQASLDDLQSLENGCSVFLKADQADRLNLPAADSTRLEALLFDLRQTGQSRE